VLSDTSACDCLDVSESSDALPADVDVRLWISTGGCVERDYLSGNPHTFPGRMETYCPHQPYDRRSFSVSKDKILECSSEAEQWIAGYLVGNEPGPPSDDDMTAGWLDRIHAFHRTGVWPQPE
jgi:hypothetical protein